MSSVTGRVRWSTAERVCCGTPKLSAYWLTDGSRAAARFSSRMTSASVNTRTTLLRCVVTFPQTNLARESRQPQRVPLEPEYPGGAYRPAAVRVSAEKDCRQAVITSNRTVTCKRKAGTSREAKL